MYKDASNYQLEIKDSERYYTIFSTLEVGTREWIKYVENNVLKVKRGDLVIELGDYIGYNQLDFKDKENYTTEYTSLEDKNGIKDQDFIIDENVTWKVFDVDEKGKLKIISSEIKTESGEHFYLKGKNAYVNAIDELNKISELYGQGYGAIYARSVNYNDIAKLDGYDASLDTSKIGTNLEDEIDFTFFWENNQTYYKTNTGLTGLNMTFGTFYYYDEKNKEWKESTKQKDYTEIATIKNINKRHQVDAKKNSYITPYIFWNNKAYQMIKANFGDEYFLADVGAFFNSVTSIMCYGVGSVSGHPLCNSTR